MRVFLLAILLLFSQVGFAADLPSPNDYQLPTSFSFTPPSTDASVGYLSVIFGVVDGVLHGTGSQIIGTMFGIMNSAVLTLGGVIIMYILVVSTLNTAHEGEVMGREWSSIWIPIRAVVGIGAMLPKATGYSFIQILVMWLVVQGVGTADSVWSAALGYFNRGGILVQPNTNLNTDTSTYASAGNTPLVLVAGNVLKAETCMNVLYNSLVLQNANNPSSGSSQSVPSFIASLQVTGAPSGNTPPCYQGDTRPGCSTKGDSGGTINFPGNVSYAGKNYQGACGSVSWDFTSSANLNSNPANLGAYDDRSVAVQQIVMDMEPLANTLAQILLPTNNSQTAAYITLPDLNPGTLVAAATDYMGIIGPYFNSQGNAAIQAAQQYFTASSQYGWLSAGSFYFVLANLNNSYVARETQFPLVDMPAAYDPSYFNAQALNALTGNVTPTVVKCPENGQDTDALNNFICSEYNTAMGQAPATAPGVPFKAPTVQPWNGKIGSIKTSKWVTSMINLIPGAFNQLAGNLNNILTDQSQTKGFAGDPIVQISQMGASIIDLIEYIWIGGAAAAFAAMLVGSACSAFTSLGGAIMAAISWFIPFLTGVMFTMFVSGAVMEYYVPLIPFILFLSAGIGWFIAVIESMVAAPLVALGLTIPDGHKHFGQAKNAFMLMLNVFIRPTLIVFGFIFGAILSHVALWVLNQGLYVALGGASQGVISTDPSHILEVVALIVIYVGLVITIINKSFALIHQLPEQVLTWIGGSQRAFGEAQFGQEVKQQFEGAAGQLGTKMQEGSKGASEQAAGIVKGAGTDLKTSIGDKGGEGGGGGGMSVS